MVELPVQVHFNSNGQSSLDLIWFARWWMYNYRCDTSSWEKSLLKQTNFLPGLLRMMCRTADGCECGKCRPVSSLQSPPTVKTAAAGFSNHPVPLWTAADQWFSWTDHFFPQFSSLQLIEVAHKLNMTASWLFLHLKVFFVCDQGTTAHLFNRQHLYLLHLFPLALTASRLTLRRGFTSSFIYVDDLLLRFNSRWVGGWSTSVPFGDKVESDSSGLRHMMSPLMNQYRMYMRWSSIIWDCVNVWHCFQKSLRLGALILSDFWRF